MIQRRMILLDTFKGSYLPTSGEKASNNKFFKKSPELKIQVVIRGIFRSTMGLLRKMYKQNKLYKNQ